jgi:hypothetical protein
MNAVNGVILIMVAIFGLYLLWAVNSPLFNRQVRRASGPPGNVESDQYDIARDEIPRPFSDGNAGVGPAEEAYYDEGTQPESEEEAAYWREIDPATGYPRWYSRAAQ